MKHALKLIDWSVYAGY